MDENVIMQPRCIHCLREQYAIAVWDISHGRSGCVWCGKVPPVFTEQTHYNGALKAARAAAATGQTSRGWRDGLALPH